MVDNYLLAAGYLSKASDVPNPALVVLNSRNRLLDEERC